MSSDPRRFEAPNDQRNFERAVEAVRAGLRSRGADGWAGGWPNLAKEVADFLEEEAAQRHVSAERVLRRHFDPDGFASTLVAIATLT